MNRTVGMVCASAIWVSGASAAQVCESIPVDSRTVHVCVAGSGPATVVLAAGAGQTSGTWAGLVPELSTMAQVVTFDRPGLGRSEPGLGPRTPTRIARELELVLEALAVDGPLVLVGHSMGGLHVLRYAALFPEGVAGVVLLDTPPPRFEEDRLALLSAAEQEQRVRLLSEGLERMPTTVRLEREGARGPEEWEFADFPRATRLVVVAADSQNFGDLGDPAEHRRLWISKSRKWLALSDQAEFVVAEGSGHMIHQDRQALVIERVKRLLTSTDLRTWRDRRGEAALRGRTWRDAFR